MNRIAFPPPPSKAALDEASIFTPRFDEHGLMPAVVVDAASGDVLMVAYVNADSLALTITTGEAHFWSRSRGEIWRKGATSGNLLRVVELRTDCDQDTLLIRARMTGAGVACHTGRTSCFYRIVTPPEADGGPATLTFDAG